MDVVLYLDLVEFFIIRRTRHLSGWTFNLLVLSHA